jgi:hypothetical protein
VIEHGPFEPHHRAAERDIFDNADGELPGRFQIDIDGPAPCPG